MKIITIQLLTLICLSLFIFSGCSRDYNSYEDCEKGWNDIDNAFDKANYCTIGPDCVFAKDTCCGRLVNSEKKDTLENYAKEIEDLQELGGCMRSCDCDLPPQTEEIACIENRCVDLRRYHETKGPQADPIEEPISQKIPVDTFTNLTEAECIEKGGNWGRFSSLDDLLCNLPTSDGGSPCRDGTECETICLANSYEDMGSSATGLGTCSYWQLNFGCHEVIEEGKIVGFCID